jgi:hypothetical protein
MVIWNDLNFFPLPFWCLMMHYVYYLYFHYWHRVTLLLFRIRFFADDSDWRWFLRFLQPETLGRCQNALILQQVMVIWHMSHGLLVLQFVGKNDGRVGCNYSLICCSSFFFHADTAASCQMPITQGLGNINVPRTYGPGARQQTIWILARCLVISTISTLP